MSPAAAGERFEWTAHPARERPWTALLVLLVVAMLPGLIAGGEAHFAWALFGSLLLLASLHRFFFATYYEFTEVGVTARTLSGTRRVAWTEVRRVRVGRVAAWLGTGDGTGWRAARRGVLIQFGRAREEIVARLRARLPDGIWQSPAPRA